jgi:hypothetical protein
MQLAALGRGGPIMAAAGWRGGKWRRLAALAWLYLGLMKIW